MDEEIYTIPEVAKYLKLSESKVYRLVQRGKIPHIRIGRNIRIKESQLQQWLDEHTQATQLEFPILFSAQLQ